MFIINGKSQGSTVRLAVGTGCAHQEIGYCLTSVSCRVTCRIDEVLKACSARSLFDSPFAFFCILQCCLSHTMFFSMNLLRGAFYRQKAWNVLEIFPHPVPHAHQMTYAY